jgi:rod shape-determining protein MreD
MRRKRNLLILSLTFTGVLFYFLQINVVNNFLAIGQNVPDLLLILTVFISLRLGQIPGSLYGFAAGLLQDVLIDFYGLQALCKTIVGFSASYFESRKILLVEKFYFPFIVLFSALIHDFVFYAVQSLDSRVDFFSLLLHYGLPNSLYTAVMSFLLWMIIPDKFINFIRYDVKYDV